MQTLYSASQAHAKELEAKLNTQRLRGTQLKSEVAAAQSHIAELSAILKSCMRPGSVSGPLGVGSPAAEPLSREPSVSEAAPRLRSQELQGGSMYAYQVYAHLFCRPLTVLSSPCCCHPQAFKSSESRIAF